MTVTLLFIVTLTGISAVYAIVFLAAWYSLGRKPHALFWAGSFGLGLLQWLANLARAGFDTDLY